VTDGIYLLYSDTDELIAVMMFTVIDDLTVCVCSLLSPMFHCSCISAYTAEAWGPAPQLILAISSGDGGSRNIVYPTPPPTFSVYKVRFSVDLVCPGPQFQGDATTWHVAGRGGERAEVPPSAVYP